MCFSDIGQGFETGDERVHYIDWMTQYTDRVRGMVHHDLNAFDLGGSQL